MYSGTGVCRIYNHGKNLDSARFREARWEPESSQPTNGSASVNQSETMTAMLPADFCDLKQFS